MRIKMPLLNRIKVGNFLVVLAMLACIGLSACANTVHGAGEDIENAGEAVQGSVDGGAR
jgi:predicted small secreted protein